MFEAPPKDASRLTKSGTQAVSGRQFRPWLQSDGTTQWRYIVACHTVITDHQTAQHSLIKNTVRFVAIQQPKNAFSIADCPDLVVEFNALVH